MIFKNVWDSKTLILNNITCVIIFFSGLLLAHIFPSFKLFDHQNNFWALFVWRPSVRLSINLKILYTAPDNYRNLHKTFMGNKGHFKKFYIIMTSEINLLVWLWMSHKETSYMWFSLKLSHILIHVLKKVKNWQGNMKKEQKK